MRYSLPPSPALASSAFKALLFSPRPKVAKRASGVPFKLDITPPLIADCIWSLTKLEATNIGFNPVAPALSVFAGIANTLITLSKPSGSTPFRFFISLATSLGTSISTFLPLSK